MTSRSFADVLAERIALSPRERTAIEALERRTREVRRGAALFREGGRGTDLFVLRSGTMMSYVLLDDGSRQILRFLFPGELIGMAGTVYRNAAETIAAVSDSVVSPFDRAALGELFTDHPRLAAMVLALSQVERAALTDRLAALGRTSAKARVAALLLDMRDRLRACGGATGAGFAPGLTQEEIGDATGLTAVHVNRMLRQLEEERLIRREGGVVELIDEPALIRAGRYIDRYERLDLGWLPDGR